MHVFGNALKNINSELGSTYFTNQYKISAFDYIIRHKITNTIVLDSQQYQSVVLLDYDDQLLQIFSLDSCDIINIYTKHKLQKRTNIVDSQDLSFLWIPGQSGQDRIYAIEDPIYSMLEEDWISLEVKQNILFQIKEVFVKYNIEDCFSQDQILFLKLY